MFRRFQERKRRKAKSRSSSERQQAAGKSEAQDQDEAQQRQGRNYLSVDESASEDSSSVSPGRERASHSRLYSSASAVPPIFPKDVANRATLRWSLRKKQERSSPVRSVPLSLSSSSTSAASSPNRASPFPWEQRHRRAGRASSAVMLKQKRDSSPALSMSSQEARKPISIHASMPVVMSYFEFQAIDHSPVNESLSATLSTTMDVDLDDSLFARPRRRAMSVGSQHVDAFDGSVVPDSEHAFRATYRWSVESPADLIRAWSMLPRDRPKKGALVGVSLSTQRAAMHVADSCRAVSAVSRCLQDVPSVIYHCTKLTSLRLSHNQIEVLPAIMATLTQLRRLAVDHNRIKALPNIVLAPLKHLTALDVRNNVISVLPRCVANMPFLRVLYLSRNRLHKFPRTLCSLSMLRSLHADHNVLARLPNKLKRLTALQHLVLRNNELTTIRSIARLPALQHLDVSFNNINGLGNKGAIVTCTALRCLRMAHNPIGTFNPEQSWAPLHLLRQLDVETCALTQLPPGLGHCASLTHLWAGHNQLTAFAGPESGPFATLGTLSLPYNRLRELPPHLASCPSLTELNVSHNELTHFPYHVTSLREISVEGNAIECLDERMAAMVHLRTLLASSNAITTLHDALSGCTSLQLLDLGSNQLHAYATCIPSLVQLELEGNAIAELSPVISGMTNLVMLDVRDNLLNDLPDEFASVTSMAILRVAGNPMHCIPTDVALKATSVWNYLTDRARGRGHYVPPRE